MSTFLIRPSQGKRKRAGIVSATQPICQICAENESRYTCPHCNLHYCSLKCFRDPKHAACVDSFSQKTLEEDLSAESARAPKAERERMIKLLQQLDDEESQEQDIYDKLHAVQLDEAGEDEMLDMLTPEQRKAFEELIKDPARAKSFLEESYQGDTPWWLVHDKNADSELEQEDERDSEVVTMNASARPEMIDVSLLPPLKKDEGGRVVVQQELVYNVVAVLFAYSYCLRTFDAASVRQIPPTSSERLSMQGDLARLCPFLFEQSTLLLPDVGSATEYVLSRVEQTVPSAFTAVLLQDCSELLQPAPVVEIDDHDRLNTHLAATTLLALSDLHSLLSSNSSGKDDALQNKLTRLIQRPSSQKKVKGVEVAARKLLFYAAFIADSGSPVDSNKFSAIADRLRLEAHRAGPTAAPVAEDSVASDQVSTRANNAPKIEELP